jgi:hypothetical protein
MFTGILTKHATGNIIKIPLIMNIHGFVMPAAERRAGSPGSRNLAPIRAGPIRSPSGNRTWQKSLKWIAKFILDTEDRGGRGELQPDRSL